jgi:hypothetical protein
MEFANSKNHNKKWGEISYEDTAEAIQTKMHKFSNPSQFTYDIPADYAEAVENAEPYEQVTMQMRRN